MKIKKVGVVGIGHLGTYHLQKYQKLQAPIAAVADISPERAKGAADLYGCRAFTDYRDMIGAVEAVSIAVPTAFHHAVASVFLDAGIHVLLEKPIATTLEEADDLIARADRNGVILQVGFIERFNPAVVALEQVIDSPMFIETHRLHPFFERGTDVDVVLDLMVHDLDIILNFVHSPLRRVEAVGIPVLSEKVDIANARIVFENGCVANITASRVTGKTMQKIRFFGAEGYHSVDYAKRELVSLGRKKKGNGETEIVENKVEVRMQDPLEAEVRSFLEAAADGREPKVSGREARKSLSLGLAILQAMKTQEALL
ncbi:MAG: Gfo/Idh/MocA family oxidoreductase [Syntrophales bacterium]|jgi:predicted dehydrogenase|nr:Gfo/Idh/MocA family oxidoreductase [Syntrophales bacterium]